MRERSQIIKQSLAYFLRMWFLIGLLGAMSCTQEEPPTSPVTLDSPQAQGVVEATWHGSGSGDSREMILNLVNQTTYEFTVQVEIGTKLAPKKGDVQNMVVTHELEVHLHPHEETTAKVEVACLDISKDPPGQSNDAWDAAKSSELVRFLACANSFIDDLKQRDADQADAVEKKRSDLVQMALWKARGTSRQQWIDFFVHYQQLTQEDAAQMADQLGPLLDEIERRCGSLGG
jgi:hypothetical protein